MEMGEIVIQNVNQVYHNVNQGDFNALSDINLHLCKGESLAIEGESGSGKSTLARLLIGIEKPTSGKILLDGEDITCWNYRTWKQHRKKIQAVFQDSSGTLNPARSAYANVEEALVNLTDKKRAERKKHILDLMDAVHMDYGLLETPVRQLSGGEQRRLSLLRAIAVEPDYLIMDEVTSGLDLISADAVLTLVENFVKLSGSSCIFITHSRKDAMRIANRIIIMREGRIAEQGYLIDQLSTRKDKDNMKQIYKKLLAAALGVSMLLSMVGCGQSDTSEQTQTDSEQTQAANENEAKVLTIVTAKELDNLTTLTMNKENNIACGLVYETLVAYEDGEIVPELAEEWGWDETNTVLTFKLRQDVAFTDGAAFNAESVKEILDFDRSNPNFSGIKGIYNIESVEVVDEYTVAVHYAAPCFSYINDFCFQNVAGMMSPNVFEAENFQTFTDVVGTGPYIREEMISGDCTRFVRNENYWGEAPYYDEVVIKYIPEASSRLQALQTGEVDLIYGADLLSYDDYNQALSLDGIEGAINDGNTLTRNLVLNASSEILSDLKVRQAIAYAVNKEEITKGLTYGYETPATSLFAPGAPYTDITYNSTWSYDLDKANALLDEAGWVMNESTGIREKDGQQLSLNYTYWTDLSLAQDMALAIKTQLAEVGIDVTTTGQDQMTWWTEGVAGNYDITTWNTEGSYTEPHKFLQESLGADPHAISLQALEDFQSYSDAVNAFSTSADPEVVQSAIATALNVSNDNVIDLPISYSKDLVVYNSSKIAGYTFSSVPQFFEIDNVQPAE